MNPCCCTRNKFADLPRALKNNNFTSIKSCPLAHASPQQSFLPGQNLKPEVHPLLLLLLLLGENALFFAHVGRKAEDGLVCSMLHSFLLMPVYVSRLLKLALLACLSLYLMATVAATSSLA